jgi:DNA topoisomerase-3
MLILCEKPSVAKEFAGTLGCRPEKGCYRNGQGVWITYCVGHLFELQSPDFYDPRYKKWTLEDLPIIPEQFKYKPVDSVREQAGCVLRLLKEHKDDDIIIATDAGREGELIARLALREAGIRDMGRIRRFWVSEALTEKVIEAGIRDAKPIESYNLTARQGLARQHADWLVGINLTRFMSVGNRVLFSVGRVQTAVLNAIAVRNDAVAKFIPKPYYELEIIIRSKAGAEIRAWLINPDTGKTAFNSKEGYTAGALDYCRCGKELKISGTTVKRTVKPPKLLNITGLEKTAYKKYGYEPKETDEAAQKLYEKYKCLSYPRTPSRVMGESNVALFLKYFHLLKGVYGTWSAYSDESLIKAGNRHIFNNAELEDHHGLIPVGVLPETAGQIEKNIFHLVVQSFFTVCMPDYIYNERQMLITSGEYRFRTNIREIVEEGWKKSLLPEEREKSGDEQEVKGFDETDCRIGKAEVISKKTNPPKEFSLDTLLSFMENPKDDAGGRKLAGLGTPATRGEIIKTLFDRGYIEDTKKKLTATRKGLFLLGQLKKDADTGKFTDVSQTTDWERQLNEDPESFEKSIKEFLKIAIKTELKETFQQESPGLCPVCKKPVYEGKRSFYCSGYEKGGGCKFVIWKEIAGAKITYEDAKVLLEGKKTAIKKFKTKEGKKFSASLKTGVDGKTGFEFQKEGKKKFKGQRKKHEG